VFASVSTASSSTAGSPRSTSIVRTVSVPRPEKTGGRRTSRQSTSLLVAIFPVAAVRSVARGTQSALERAATGRARSSARGVEARTTRAVAPVRRALT